MIPDLKMLRSKLQKRSNYPKNFCKTTWAKKKLSVSKKALSDYWVLQ